MVLKCYNTISRDIKLLVFLTLQKVIWHREEIQLTQMLTIGIFVAYIVQTRNVKVELH